uniref:Secreted protein n=1 Tax=Plectus sambesii TaxID=2011161 RepID=A0A914X7U2_9BILA
MAFCCAAAIFVIVCSTFGKTYAHDPVETIVDVEATANSLTLHTDAAGGTAGLRILIEIYDLAANEQQLKTLDLSGPLLENTRGSYLLQNLKPSTWFGISFKTEQTTSGSTRAAVENRLARTLTAEGTEDYPLYEVSTSADSQRADELQLTVKRVPIELNIELIVSAALECDGVQSNKQDIQLADNETKATAILQVGYTPEIVPADDGSGRVTAVLTPGKCNQLCWSPWLRYTTTKDHRTYSYRQNETCQPIETVNITSGLRRVISRTATDQSITVNTLYNMTGQPERDAFVTISTYQLTTTNMTSSSSGQPEWLVSNFSVDWTSVNFTVDDLASGQWYAVLYNYTKLTPFVYNDVLRFVAFTAGGNDSDNEGLVKINLQAVENRLNMTLSRSHKLAGRRVTTSFSPFCGQNGTSVVLTDERPEQLVDFDISLARCLLFPDKCDKNANDSALIAALTADDADDVSGVTDDDCEHLCYRCEMSAPMLRHQREQQLGQQEEEELFIFDRQCLTMRDVFAKSDAPPSATFSPLRNAIALFSFTLLVDAMLRYA